VAFFATGAYLTALFTGANRVTSLGDLVAPAFVLHLNFYLAVPFVIIVTAFVGLLIGAPVLRLRGDYLAIVTLGFGEIARVLVQSSWLQEFTGGPQGLRDVTDAAIGGVGFRDPQPFFYLVLVFCGPGHLRVPAPGRLPGRAGLERHARGRDGRRGDGREHDQVQAAGLRHGRGRGLPVGRAVRRADRLDRAGQLHHPGLHHRPGVVILGGWAASPAWSSARCC
jgi:hypothetical protein